MKDIEKKNHVLSFRVTDVKFLEMRIDSIFSKELGGR
jgi:hypothetical protein